MDRTNEATHVKTIALVCVVLFLPAWTQGMTFLFCPNPPLNCSGNWVSVGPGSGKTNCALASGGPLASAAVHALGF